MNAADDQPREERRVVTVLFADLVGFTERSEELDPEDVRALLTRYYGALRSRLELHGGVVDKFIGDAVMAVFGAPVAHEDDPERAVRAALAIRDWARSESDVDLRVGVNTGTALVGLDPLPQGIGLVAGDMVNTAARIQGAAETGSILVGQATFEATRDVFAYEERRAIEAKGKSEPVRVFEPLAAQVPLGASRRVGGAPLVGRVRELALLRSAFERVVEGDGPRLVTIVGVPGIGKTRLLSELRAHALSLRPEVTWLEGRSLPYGDRTSFRGLGETVRTVAGVVETDGLREAERKLQHAVAALTSDESDARWLVSQLRPLVGVTVDTPAFDDRREDAFAVWRRFFELLAQRGPLVLVAEDLHWADDAILDFLGGLALSAEPLPLLVVGTARPELLDRRAGWAEETGRCTSVRLEPLTAADTATLIGALTEEVELDVDLAGALLERAGGNPLYAEELVRIVAEGDGAPDAALPHSIQGIIAARLDLLTAEEKELLQDASVVGQVFWPGALRHVSGLDTQLDELLDSLERKEYVHTAPGSTVAHERELGFRHLLIREVTYGQIPRARRADRHRRAAEWVESLPAGRVESRADMLAEHYLRAIEYAAAASAAADELRGRAARALREAGDQARSFHSLELAAARYSQALELADGEEERGWTALALAEVELRTGALEAAHRRLDDVIEIARARALPTLLARAALARGGVGVRVFDPDDTLVALLREALEALAEGRHPGLRARVLARLATEVYYEDPPTLREELSEEAVRLARRANEPEALLDALNARRVTLWSPDRLDERLAVSRELVALAESAGDRERSLVARTWLVTDLVEGGDLGSARAEIDAYAQLVEPLGIGAYSWWVPAWRAMLAGLEGRFDELRMLADEAEQIGTRAGDGNAGIYRGLARWIADAEQGRDYDVWLQQIEAGVARDGPSDAFRCGLAMQLALAGRLDEARAALAELGPAGIGAVVKDMNFYAGAGEFTVAVGILGHAEAARRAYDTLRPYAGRMFLIARAAVCWGPADAFLGRLAATAGLFDEAESHFDAALDACDRIGARAMAARTRWWYAWMLRARGGPGDAERATELEGTAEREAEALGLALEPTRG